MTSDAMTPDAAGAAVRDALRRIVPDADLDACGPETNLREEFELDSLDFLAFVEQLSTRTGRRIDEDDYDKLTSLSTCIDFLTRQRV